MTPGDDEIAELTRPRHRLLHAEALPNTSLNWSSKGVNHFTITPKWNSARRAPPFAARTKWPAVDGPLAMTYDSFDEISAPYSGFKDVPGPDGDRVRNWRQVGKKLRLLLHHLQDVLWLDVRVDIESGFQDSKLGQPFFGAVSAR